MAVTEAFRIEPTRRCGNEREAVKCQRHEDCCQTLFSPSWHMHHPLELSCGHVTCPGGKSGSLFTCHSNQVKDGGSVSMDPQRLLTPSQHQVECEPVSGRKTNLCFLTLRFGSCYCSVIWLILTDTLEMVILDMGPEKNRLWKHMQITSLEIDLNRHLTDTIFTDTR